MVDGRRRAFYRKTKSVETFRFGRRRRTDKGTREERLAWSGRQTTLSLMLKPTFIKGKKWQTQRVDGGNFPDGKQKKERSPRSHSGLRDVQVGPWGRASNPWPNACHYDPSTFGGGDGKFEAKSVSCLQNSDSDPGEPPVFCTRTDVSIERG